jgi:hypothetical protein
MWCCGRRWFGRVIHHCCGCWLGDAGDAEEEEEEDDDDDDDEDDEEEGEEGWMIERGRAIRPRVAVARSAR